MSAPASSTSLIATDVLHDRGHVLGLDELPVAVVDRDHRRVAAAAEALDRAERDLAVLGGLARRDPELGLEGVDHLLRARERAREVGADLDRVPADGRQVEHVVEGRDCLAIRGGRAERVADLLERLGRQPAAVLFLREAQRRQDRRARVGILRGDLANLAGKAHRSTSPMTVSSEPTIAIRSATSASDMQVAVASSATKLGARNLTRHGFGPPFETT